MKVIGIFRDLGRGVSPSMPLIRDASDLLLGSEAPLVADYLRSGVPVFDVMEATVDPFDNSVRIDGGPSLISDGLWIWRNDLAYFVEKYRIGLPNDFVSYALANKGRELDEPAILAQWQEIVSAYDLAEKGLG